MTDTPLAAAQQDLARAYAGGAPGVLVSGLVWLIAGAVWQFHGTMAAFAALFVGGMAIHPLGVLIERIAFKGPKATVGKPLETLAIEATIPLFVGVLIAWVLLVRAPDLAIPVFAALTKDEKRELAEATTMREFRKGDVIVSEGDVLTTLMMVRAGVIAMRQGLLPPCTGLCGPVTLLMRRSSKGGPRCGSCLGRRRQPSSSRRSV